jgi:hypothetical protein
MKNEKAKKLKKIKLFKEIYLEVKKLEEKKEGGASA